MLLCLLYAATNLNKSNTVYTINERENSCNKGEYKMWFKTSKELPDDGEVVETKIDDGRGCRNEIQLMFKNNMWVLPDGSMYVYYTPTH